MFDDDLERALDRAYGADERAKAAVRADLVAMHDHDTLDATGPHGLIARTLWGALRTLGTSGGRMLVLGQDAELFAGLPAAERCLRPGGHAGFTAQIPATAPSQAGMAPHAGLRLLTWQSEQDKGGYDVVISVPGYTDVVLHREMAAEERRAEQILGLIGCLANTGVGGYTAGLVSRDVLDDADVDSRRLLTEFGELVGALRLPSGALRDNPGTDSIVDLVILRRHDGTPIQPQHQFLPAPMQDLRGKQVRVNQYFLDQPQHILGRLAARASSWGPPDLVVHPTGLGLDRDLTNGFAAITSSARETGLTAGTQRRPDLDAPIEDTIVHRSDLDAVRRRIRSLRAAKARPATEHPPAQPGGSNPSGPRREDGAGPHL